jgi:hypothetical protein
MTAAAAPRDGHETPAMYDDVSVDEGPAGAESRG